MEFSPSTWPHFPTLNYSHFVPSPRFSVLILMSLRPQVIELTVIWFNCQFFNKPRSWCTLGIHNTLHNHCRPTSLWKFISFSPRLQLSFHPIFLFSLALSLSPSLISFHLNISSFVSLCVSVSLCLSLSVQSYSLLAHYASMTATFVLNTQCSHYMMDDQPSINRSIPMSAA